ncbi:MAG: hypothetical protein Q9221_001824 [Calogaya cf. arnoldii]
MDQIKKCKTFLHGVATRELNAVEHAVRQELSRLKEENALAVKGCRDENEALQASNEVLLDDNKGLQIKNKALQHKNKALQYDVDCLQQQVSRTSELEHDLQVLRAPRTLVAVKEEDTLSNDGTSTIKASREHLKRLYQNKNKPSEEQKEASSKDVDHYRQQFIECSKELDRVKKARAILESKCKAWKEKYQYLALQRNSENLQSEYREDPPRPGSAPVTKSKRGPELLLSTAPESASNVSGGAANLVDLGESPKAPPDARIDQDDAETSDESDHLAAAEDRSNVNGPSNNDEVSTDHPRIKRSQSEEPVVVHVNTINVPAKRKRELSPINASRNSKLKKEETLSSSPIPQNARPSTAAVQESIDLDEISGDIYTPRKDQRNRQQNYSARSLSPSIQRMLDARPPKQMRPENPNNEIEECNSDLAASENEREAIPDVAEVRDDAYYKRLGEEHAARLRDADKWKRAEKLEAKRRLHNERQVSKHKDTKEAELWAMQHPSAAVPNNPGHMHVLQPTDPNAILPRTGDIPSSKKRKMVPRSDHGARRFQQLAEDGEKILDTENELLDGELPYQAVSSNRGVRNLFPSRAETRQRRLDQLLTRPSPEKPLLNARVNKAQVANLHSARPVFARRVAAAVAPKTPNPERQDRSNASVPSNSVSAAARAFKPVNTPNYRSPFAQSSLKKPIKSLEPPLRSWPLSQLALDDFKINPNQNQGYDYAFKEVVRKQDQRKCLPGCTRLDCCGRIFREMAEVMPNHFYHTSRLMGSSQECDERGMMEDYLGDQAYQLKTMSPVQKAETLLQAKTKIMADHYGRHREVYAREPSPVGYWDVDMPNSQEAAEYSRLAEIQTRQKVEERYREALKQDGQWKFRDE